MHILLDQYAPNLSARLGALSLENRRRVIGDTCLLMSDRIEELEVALRSIIHTAARNNALSREEVAAVRAYAQTADDRYFDLQSNATTTPEALRWFVKARLATALAAAFGSSHEEAAADAAYELCVVESDSRTVVRFIEAAIDRIRNAE